MGDTLQSLIFMKLVGKFFPHHTYYPECTEDCYVALESALHPGQHVGVFENGNLKLAAETTPMDPTSFFIPFPVEPPSFGSGVAGQELPAGWQSARTPEGREYFINHTTQETSWIRPSVGPATPIGYSLRVSIRVLY